MLESLFGGGKKKEPEKEPLMAVPDGGSGVEEGEFQTADQLRGLIAAEKAKGDEANRVDIDHWERRLENMGESK